MGGQQEGMYQNSFVLVQNNMACKHHFNTARPCISQLLDYWAFFWSWFLFQERYLTQINIYARFFLSRARKIKTRIDQTMPQVSINRTAGVKFIPSTSTFWFFHHLCFQQSKSYLVASLVVPLTFRFYFYQGWSYYFHCIIYCLVLHLQTVSGKVQGLSRVQILTLVPTYQDHWDMKAISYMSKKFCKLPCTRTKEYKSCSYKKKRSRKLTKEKRKIEILSFPWEKKKMKMKKTQQCIILAIYMQSYNYYCKRS